MTESQTTTLGKVADDPLYHLACEAAARAAKNSGTAEQLLVAPIYFALRDHQAKPIAPHLGDSYEPTMDIYSKPGTMVRFRAGGGYPYEKARALKAGFVENAIYTVKRCDVGQSMTEVLLDNVEGRWNSCLFADLTPVALAIPTQDPKYSIRAGRLVNAQTGEAIPEDEPVFMFRARDRQALDALWSYLDRCENRQHREAVRVRIEHFLQFAKNHADRMKEPDTDPVHNQVGQQ